MGLLSGKKDAFDGMPYDSSSYYGSGMVGQIETFRTQLCNNMLAGGVEGVKIQPWSISMKKWFSEKRDYLIVRYSGVEAYILVHPFGRDLYVSWLSFFKLGCLQRIMRLGWCMPTDLDVDDLNMLGEAMDLYIRTTLDEVAQAAGVSKDVVAKVVKRNRRKRFVKA